MRRIVRGIPTWELPKEDLPASRQTKLCCQTETMIKRWCLHGVQMSNSETAGQLRISRYMTSESSGVMQATCRQEILCGLASALPNRDWPGEYGLKDRGRHRCCWTERMSWKRLTFAEVTKAFAKLRFFVHVRRKGCPMTSRLVRFTSLAGMSFLERQFYRVVPSAKCGETVGPTQESAHSQEPRSRAVSPFANTPRSCPFERQGLNLVCAKNCTMPMCRRYPT